MDTLALMSYLEAFINSMSLSLLYLSIVVLIVFIYVVLMSIAIIYRFGLISLVLVVELLLYASVAIHLIKKLSYV